METLLLTKIQVSEKIKQNRLMLLSNGAVCSKKKSFFLKKRTFK